MISGHRDIEHGLRTLLLQAESELDRDFSHALRTCDAAFVLGEPLTFAPASSLETADWNTAWQLWLTGVFSPAVAPVLLAAARHAHAAQYRELISLDQGFSGSLGPSAATSSSATGRKMLGRLAGARGARWLDRFQTAAQTNSTPAHFAVVYACQAAFFHLAPRLMLATYAYWEWSVALVAHQQPKQGATATFQSISAPLLRRINEEQIPPLTAHADQSRRALP